MTEYNEYEFFVSNAKDDAGFSAFVEKVSPNGQVQQVWIAELFLVLKILWEIYSILKKFGFFAAWWETRKVKAAMRSLSVREKEHKLSQIRNGLLKTVGA